jgi:hypothetical protein
MKRIHKNIPVMLLQLTVMSALVFTNCEVKEETKNTSKQLSAADAKANQDKRKKWEASPDGIKYKEWQASPAGKKVQASHDKIRKYIKDFSAMEAVVTSVTFQRENAKSGPKWLIVKINNEDYMMQYNLKDFEQLKSLKVNDKIIVKSRSVGYSNNHPYLILSGDYIAKNNKVIFKRDFSKNKGC